MTRIRQPVKLFTNGSYETEPEAWREFDRLVARSECFREPHREVHGTPLQPRMFCEKSGFRIDRILVPTKKLIDSGWQHGPIGVEGKRSDKPIGKLIAQATDYSRAVWHLPHGFNIVLDWVFVWPLDDVGGDIGSLMAQSRIGYVMLGRGGSLSFGSGGMHAIHIAADGTLREPVKNLPSGRKAGSR